jgi:hypothetical protein
MTNLFEYQYRVNRKSYEVLDGKAVNDKYTIYLSIYGSTVHFL